MIKKRIQQPESTPPTKPFHETFPYALEWFVKQGKKNLQHNAYFPYEDYRNDYARKLKSTGATGIKKFKTKPREDV